MSANQEQPGQVSPSGELARIMMEVHNMIDRLDSEAEPFKSVCYHLRLASEDLCNAGAELLLDHLKPKESPHEH